MVAAQIAARGVRSPAILAAMRTVPREEFVPEHLRDFACDDAPLPIGFGQTISQPHVVALMIDALRLSGTETVLEVGGGSGYAAAVLGQVAARVYSIERIAELAGRARVTVTRLGYDNVEIVHGDGTRGLPEHAPFDAIVVAAGGTEVPEPLKQQLKPGGTLVIPVGRSDHSQQLLRITREPSGTFTEERLAPVRFVPLIPEEEPAARS